MSGYVREKLVSARVDFDQCDAEWPGFVGPLRRTRELVVTCDQQEADAVTALIWCADLVSQSYNYGGMTFHAHAAVAGFDSVNGTVAYQLHGYRDMITVPDV